jgi:hypothetical protein
MLSAYDFSLREGFENADGWSGFGSVKAVLPFDCA